MLANINSSIKELDKLTLIKLKYLTNLKIKSSKSEAQKVFDIKKTK